MTWKNNGLAQMWPYSPHRKTHEKYGIRQKCQGSQFPKTKTNAFKYLIHSTCTMYLHATVISLSLRLLWHLFNMQRLKPCVFSIFYIGHALFISKLKNSLEHKLTRWNERNSRKNFVKVTCLVLNSTITLSLVSIFPARMCPYYTCSRCQQLYTLH